MKEISFIIKAIHPLMAKDEDILCFTFPDAQIAKETAEHISRMIARKEKLKAKEDKKKVMCLFLTGTFLPSRSDTNSVLITQNKPLNPEKSTEKAG